MLGHRRQRLHSVGESVAAEHRVKTEAWCLSEWLQLSLHHQQQHAHRFTHATQNQLRQQLQRWRKASSHVALSR